MKHALRTTLSTLSLLAVLPIPLSAAATEVVTSIKPLQLIASALTDGITRPALLLPPEGTPHHYALKPSDMRALTEAQVVIWVGPGLEQSLQKPLSRTDAHIVTLAPESVPHAHDTPTGDKGDDHGDHGDHEADKASEAGHQGHAHGNDPHIWLDPLTALDIADRMLPALQLAFPQQVERLVANRAAFEQAVRNKDVEIRIQLEPYTELGFYVFHDAYSGFINHYGLKQLGYFTVDPARRPGARHLAEIRHQLEQSHAVCVFSEPQFTSAVVDAITSGLSVQLGELDPLARDATVGPEGYTDYLQSLADDFVNCLQGKDQES